MALPPRAWGCKALAQSTRISGRTLIATGTPASAVRLGRDYHICLKRSDNIIIMANGAPLISSLICALIHTVGIAYYRPHILYAGFLCTGVAASVANHALTSRTIKWVDRSCMIIGVPITIWLAPNLFIQASTVGACIIFIAAKRHKSVYLHSLSHYMITAINMAVITQA